MNKFKNLFSLTLKLVNWIHQVFKLSEIRPLREYSILLDRLLLIGKSRGPTFLLEYIKKVRLALLIHLSGEFPVKKITGIRVTKDGVPIILGPLIKYVCNGRSPAVLQVLNTVLFCTRALNQGTSPDIGPIIGPLKKGLPDIGQYSRGFWKELGYRFTNLTPKALHFKKWHMTTKSGPNGHALWTSLADLKMTSSEMRDHLKIVGGPKLSDHIDHLTKVMPYLESVLPTEGKTLRKLTWFPDKENKVRVIAIGDYISQAALKPLHHYLFRVLRKISQDCTFNQASFKDKIKDWTEFYSIDLTAATDRFPIQTIYDVLKGHIPEEYLKSWKWLMVGIPFDFQGSKISYSVGNPMGFYSSWASFTVAHHYIMYYCCRELGIPWKESKYCMLGDDILIGDRLLADKYRDTISSLGVEFSPLKTHSSTHFCEFAKRMILRGDEITPFPVSSIKESSRRYYLLVNLLVESAGKGWMAINGIPSVISGFYEYVRPKRSKFRSKIFTDSLICELIMKVMRGTESAGMALNTIIRQLDYPIRELTDEESKGILSSVSVETFADSNPTNSITKGYPLGLLAENLVMYLTGIEDPDNLELLITCTHKIPHLACYGQIEEAYVNINKEAYRIDTVGGGDWPLLLKTMAIPLDDRVFIQRQNHLVSKASAMIGKHLRSRFEFFMSPIGRAMLGPKA